MQRFLVYRRGIVNLGLVTSLLFGLFASNSFIGGTAFRKPEPNKPNSQISSVHSQSSLADLPVYFEENRGRTNGAVRYLARGNGGATLFLTATEAVYLFRSPAAVDSATSLNSQQPKAEDSALAVHMKLSGANENAAFAGEEQLEHQTNYFVGSDSSGWQTGVPNYRRVLVNDIYDGVDMIWHGKTRGEVQYDFIVKPNANPAQIEWQVEGARNVSIDADGSLLIETELGVMRQGKPFSYQDSDGLRAQVESRYVVSGNLTSNTSNRDSFTVKFEVGDYDRSRNLTIDPSVDLSNLAFSTLLGGNADDYGSAIAVDSAGNVYVTGMTLSAQFPTTAGTVDTSLNGGDVFVTKLSASGALIYSTFIGGNSGDMGAGIAIDASGSAYLTGMTQSADFPTTAGAFGVTLRGGNDVFVTKLNASGTGLIYSGITGGASVDGAAGIAVDASGNVYLAGATESANFPAMAGAFDATHNGSGDVFVMKLNPTGATVIYSTFIGGNAYETGIGISIAIDSAGNAYLTGQTASINYPTTAGAFDTTSNGMNDAFVTKLNASGSALIYSTFIGGNSFDTPAGIAIDSSGNVYLTGSTASTNYPTTSGAFDTTIDAGSDVFVTKLNATGSALIYSTFIGATSNDSAAGIAVDASGNAYLTGTTLSTTFPTTPGAFDTSHNGNVDVFVTKLNPRGNALVYSTFIGGGSGELVHGMAIDSSGNICITGETGLLPGVVANYPTTSEIVQQNFNGGAEIFVSKLGDFAISGRAVDAAGLPLANVAVAMSGARSAFMLTDGQGYFGFTDTVARGSFTIAATHPNLNFAPSDFQINSLTRNQEFVFLGRR